MSRLSEIIHKIDWELIKITKTKNNLRDDQVGVGFFKNHKNENLINKVRIKVGFSIMERLEWKIGDRVNVYFDPDDAMIFRLVKHPTGYKIAKEKGTLFSTINFVWQHPRIKLDFQKMSVVEHFIYKDSQLIFRAKPSKMDD